MNFDLAHRQGWGSYCSLVVCQAQDLYVIDDDQNVLTHYTYDGSRFSLSQVGSQVRREEWMVPSICTCLSGLLLILTDGRPEGRRALIVDREPRGRQASSKKGDRCGRVLDTYNTVPHEHPMGLAETLDPFPVRHPPPPVLMFRPRGSDVCSTLRFCSRLLGDLPVPMALAWLLTDSTST